MGYRDSLRQIQRLLDTFEPLQRQLRQMEEVRRKLNQFRPPVQAVELERYVRAVEAAMPDPRLLFDTKIALANAIRPLPDLRRIVPPVELYRIASSLDAVNAAIRDAPFLGELDGSDDELVCEDGDDLADRAERQLIEVVPAGPLEKLRHVEFAPLTLLDRVLRNPELMRSLDARDFETFVAGLVEHLGFENVILTPRSGDGGRDVLATKRIHGISVLCAFECKRYAADRPVGADVARALLGVITHGSTRATKGVLVTTSYFAPAARKFILTEPSLDGRDFDGIVDWLHECAAKQR